MRTALRVYIALLLAGTLRVAAQQPAATPAVHMQGVKPAMKNESPVGGFLTPLNGKVKMRATEVTFEPGGMLGDHLHAGPGIRYVSSGELTFVDQTGKENVVRAGEYMFESGDQNIKAYNRGNVPAKVVVFELIPADWQGSAMVPLQRREQLISEGQSLQKSVCQVQASGK
jgi:quercetin dioxygenase-like cupin family protein